jgi:hypothetical protein
MGGSVGLICLTITFISNLQLNYNNLIVHFLKKPHPFPESINQKIGASLSSGFLVSLFLWIFSPFDIQDTPVDNINLYIAGFGLVTVAVTMLTTLFIPIALPLFFLESNWTVGKNILYTLLSVIGIGFANLFYNHLITGQQIVWIDLLKFQFYTLSVTLFLISVTTFIRYNTNQAFYSKNALLLNKEIAEEKTGETQVHFFLIQSESEKEELRVTIDSLLYVEAADNYCKFYLLTDEKVKTRMLRVSLKKVEEQLLSPCFFRCHRSYIVNINQIEEVRGNSQGYKIVLKSATDPIPVSRQLSTSFIEKVKMLNK